MSAAQINYWQQQLDEVPALNGLTVDYPRQGNDKYQSAIICTKLSVEVAEGLAKTASAFDITPFMLVHSALAIVIACHSNTTDIVMGVGTGAIEKQTANEQTDGFQVLRLNTGHRLLADYLNHVRQTHDDASANNAIPFEQMLDLFDIPRHSLHMPLFQIMLTQGERCNELAKNKAYDLDINVDFCPNATEQGLCLNWTYNQSIFKQAHVEQFNDHLSNLLTGLAELDAQQLIDQPAIKDLPMLTAPELNHLLVALNDTQQPFARQRCIHELFEIQVGATPDKIGAVFGQQSLSYSQINQRANQVAHYLRSHYDIKPDSLVGLCVDRSLDMVIGVMAIVKAGGAFVPLDPEYPQHRLAFMLDDADLSVVLTQQPLREKIDFADHQTICLQSDVFDRCPNTNIPVQSIGLSANNLVYVIYTSGSTGQPKGVMVEHQQLTHFMINCSIRYDIQANDRVMQFSTMCFDIFPEEYFGALTLGATLVLRDESVMGGLGEFYQFCEQYDITHTLLPTAFWHQMVMADIMPSPRKLRAVILGGEAVQQSIVQRWKTVKNHHEVINTYGPTEATITSTGFHITADYNEPKVPIGTVNPNVSLFILNEAGQLLPFGCTGLLFIGGSGVSRGYLNQPQMSAEKFIDNPYYKPQMTNSSPYLYASGDLVRYLPNGHIDFIGRNDDQVKIRGFRIELGEVQHQLSACEGVTSSVVVVLEQEPGQKSLVAYVVLEDKGDMDDSQLAKFIKQQLADELPDYMVPSFFVLMDEWPLTPNGKIDKRSLPAPDFTLLQGAYCAPVTPTETTLTGIWAKLLKLTADTISTDTAFFDLGGNSLLCSRMCVEVMKSWSVQLQVVDVFKQQSINNIALVVDDKIKNNEQGQSAAGQIVNNTIDDCDMEEFDL